VSAKYRQVPLPTKVYIKFVFNQGILTKKGRLYTVDLLLIKVGKYKWIFGTQPGEQGSNCTKLFPPGRVPCQRLKRLAFFLYSNAPSQLAFLAKIPMEHRDQKKLITMSIN
jgi:hypothetical protein